MKNTLKAALVAAGLLVATQAVAQVTFYDRENLRGRSFTADRPVANFERFGFNDRAASAVVENGAWEACENARFSGRCVVLQPGRYDTLSRVGLNFQISSVRPANAAVAYNEGDHGYNDRPRYVAQDENFRRHRDERIFQADIVDVRAVMGPPGQQCWTEQRQVVEPQRNDAQVGGAIAGAILGGILGHQIGSGRGNDVATAAGAVGGAALGSNIAGRNGDNAPVVSTQDVQRCREVSNDRPDYYEVTYRWNGEVHRVQTTEPPAGRTIAVNQHGEPRI